MLEKRKHRRISIYPLTVKFIHENKNGFGFITNLSEGGANLWTNWNVPDDSFYIKIMPELNNGSPILLKAIKVRENKIFESTCSVIGCHFIDSDLEQKEIIDKLISILDNEVENKFRSSFYTFQDQMNFVNVA